MAKPKPTTERVAHGAVSKLMYVGGKESAITLGEMVRMMAETASGIGSAWAGMAESTAAVIGGAVTMGLASAVSAAITQREYRHERNEVKKHCREELSVK